MALSLRNISFWCVTLCVTIFSASLPSKGLFPSFFSHPLKSHGAASVRHGLAKTSSALVYAKIGSQQFNNDGTDDTPVWTLSSRDTIIYDEAGHEILSMSSTASSGWSPNSLSSLDSTVYSNGKIVETVSKNFYGISTYGNRTTNAFLNGDRIIIMTTYDWNNLTKTWVPSYKDSIIFSAAAGISTSGPSDLTNLTGMFSWNFDTTNHKNIWTSAGYYAKTAGECKATTLVLTGKGQTGLIDSLVDEKMSFTFTSSIWTEANLTQMVMQMKASATGNFINVYKSIKEVNASGYLTGSENFEWDTVHSAWAPNYKSLNLPDAHGNDTFDLSVNYDPTTSIGDTTSMHRYALTYDANGNNTEMLTSTYDSYNGTWSLSGKTVNMFAKIVAAVRGKMGQTAQENIVVKISPASITFAGLTIKGVDLCNATGRVVYSINRKSAAELSLNLASNAASIPAGVYIAQLWTASGKVPIRWVVCR